MPSIAEHEGFEVQKEFVCKAIPAKGVPTPKGIAEKEDVSKANCETPDHKESSEQNSPENS